MHHRTTNTSRISPHLPRAISLTRLLVALLIFPQFCLHSQFDSSTVTGGALPNAMPLRSVVGAILCMGNHETKSEIILREMTLAVGDTITDDEIEYCKTRIYSLGLFNRVDIEYPPIDTTVLLVRVDERWFIYPVPILGVVDRDLRKWYYGLGAVHNNFRGWNEKLFGGFALGYNPWVKFEYSNPYLFDEAAIFSSTVFQYAHKENKSILSRGIGDNFFETQYGAYQSIGKRFDQYRRMSISIGYQYLEVSEKRAGRTASPNGIDRYVSASITASHDTRNLREYPTRGFLGSIGASKSGFGEGEVDCGSFVFDVRTYIPLPLDLSFAWRAVTGLSFGPTIPNYQHFFFGFGERLRGHFSEEIEGENMFLSSVELRIPILPAFYIHMPQVPVKQFATWRLGLYAALFVDGGMLWDKHEAVTWSNKPMGYGGGLHFLFPYGYVGRIEYAWNELGVGQLIFDVGASF